MPRSAAFLAALLSLCSAAASAADAVTYWNDKVVGVTIALGRKVAQWVAKFYF